jgi:ribosome-binding ATPase YchF (GTP1/OBG family)
MKKETIDEIIEKMVGTHEAEAIIFYIEGLIDELKNIDTIQDEIELKGRQITKKELEKVIFKLSLEKKDKKIKSEYN